MKKYLISMILFFGFLAAFSALPVKKIQLEEVRLSKKAAVDVLQEIRSAYINKDRVSIILKLADDFLIDISEVEKQLDNDFATNNTEKLVIKYKEVKIIKDKIVVNTNWKKDIVVISTGRRMTREGATSFVFVIRDGRHKILNWSGDRLF